MESNRRRFQTLNWFDFWRSFNIFDWVEQRFGYNFLDYFWYTNNRIITAERSAEVDRLVNRTLKLTEEEVMRENDPDILEPTEPSTKPLFKRHPIVKKVPHKKMKHPVKKH